jgi:hypothetical protein
MIDTCTYIGPTEDSSSARLQPTCCQPTVLGKSYCADHVFLVYKQGTARAKRKKDLRIAAAVWDLEAEFNAAVEELVAEGYNFEEPLWDLEVEEA